MVQGINVKSGENGSRIEIECPHQNGLLYAVKAEASWVCTDELVHAHAMAGFLGDLVAMGDPKVADLMQVWGLYYRKRPLKDSETV